MHLQDQADAAFGQPKDLAADADVGLDAFRELDLAVVAARHQAVLQVDSETFKDHLGVFLVHQGIARRIFAGAVTDDFGEQVKDLGTDVFGKVAKIRDENDLVLFLGPGFGGKRGERVMDEAPGRMP